MIFQKVDWRHGRNCIFLFCVLLILLPLSSLAQTDPVREQDWLIRNQQNILEGKKRDSEFETIKKERERKKKEEREAQEEDLKISGKPAQCFPVKEINFIDANLLSERQKRKISEPFLGRCFEGKILQELVAAVTNHYQARGYITVQILVPKQNVQSGILALQIIEGKIEKISFDEDRITNQMQKFTAFGNAEGKVLNANDISQGMYQINRLQSNAANMQIKPGSADGLSEIVIANNKKFPARATIAYDNLGNDFTGARRTNFSGSLDNALFLNDNINLSYTTNLDDDSQKKDIRSFSSGISIPFKYNTFSYDYAHSEFRGIIANNSLIKYTGFSQQSKFGAERVLLNKANLRLTTPASLTAKSSASYQGDEKQINSGRKLTIANIGFSASSYLNDTTSIYLKPSYSKGTKLLDAKQDQKNISRETAKAQFEVFKLYANFSKKFTLPKIDAPLVFISEMDSQYSKDTLFGSEQFSVGGYYSVRGFRENYINGDSGYYFRNKVNFNIGSVILPLINKENPGYLTHLNQFKLEPFYDYGYSKHKYADNGADGRLSGTGIKTLFESRKCF